MLYVLYHNHNGLRCHHIDKMILYKPIDFVFFHLPSSICVFVLHCRCHCSYLRFFMIFHIFYSPMFNARIIFSCDSKSHFIHAVILQCCCNHFRLFTKIALCAFKTSKILSDVASILPYTPHTSSNQSPWSNTSFESSRESVTTTIEICSSFQLLAMVVTRLYWKYFVVWQTVLTYHSCGWHCKQKFIRNAVCGT